VNAAAEANAKVAQEALDWYKQAYADQAPARDAAAERANAVSDAQLEAMKTATDQAKDLDTYNKTTFRPLEQSIVSSAQDYDTPERRAAAATAATTDVNSQFAASEAANDRALMANGVNPGSARAMAVRAGEGVDRAKASAGAAYMARQGVEQQGYAREMDAAALGRGLPSAQATQQQIATSTGSAAVGSSGAGLGAVQSGNSTMGQGFNTAISGNASAGALYGQAANIQNQAAQSDDAMLGAVGQIGGAALFKYSDEEIKSDVQPVGDDEALDAVNATPVQRWRYDPAKMAAKGVSVPNEDQGENVGPMAQDVRANMGEGAAPGGKKINLVTLNGITMRGLQAVDKKVDKLAGQVTSLAAMIRGGSIQAGARA
jgi:hypothetical protein